MTYRRTWFGCVLWILYTILCIILLISAGTVWVSYFAGHPYMRGFPDSVAAPLAGIPDGVMMMLGLLILPITVALYCAVRKIAGQIRKKFAGKMHASQITECIVAVLAFAGGIFLRIDSAGFYLSMISADNSALQELVSGIEYYRLSVVTAGEGIISMRYDMAHLYVLSLSVVLSFLGNKIASVIMFQIFLQAVGMALSYIVTRKTAGRLPACIVLVYMACSFSCIRMIVCFGPEWLFFDLYMIIMMIAVSYVRSYCSNQLRRPLALLCSVVVGIMIGALAYLEPTAVTLLIVMAAVAIGKKDQQEGMETYCSVGLNAAVIVTAFLTCILGWIGMTAVLAYSGRTTFVEDMEKWLEFHIQNVQFFGFASMYPYILDIYMMGLLVIPASFLIFEFFRSGREQNYMLWLLMCILVAPTPRTVIGVQPYGILSIYIWAVLAGLGLQNCIFGGGTKIMQEVIEEINQTVEEAEETEEKPRFIENPLPLPKKHVKREMDYQYPVEEKDLNYDVEVSENDDYDLQ